MEGNRDRRVGQGTDSQFFALLRSGLWNEVPERAPFTAGPDWEALYGLASAQTVVPLVTDGINRLPGELLPADPERLDPFIGSLMTTAERNRRLDAFIPKLFRALAGIPVVLVKGQSLAVDYPDPERRQPGDIDLLVPPASYEAAKAVLLPKATKVEEEAASILHQGMFFHSVEVEVHGSISTLLSRKLDRKLAALLEEQFDGRPLPEVSLGEARIPIPEADFNAVYIFVHFLHHYWSGGVGLRQVVDWMTFVSVHKRDIHPVILEIRLKEPVSHRNTSDVRRRSCPSRRPPIPGRTPASGGSSAAAATSERTRTAPAGRSPGWSGKSIPSGAWCWRTGCGISPCSRRSHSGFSSVLLDMVYKDLLKENERNT